MGDRPHWYLCVIGTDPTFAGKGYGSQAMKEHLEMYEYSIIESLNILTIIL